MSIKRRRYDPKSTSITLAPAPVQRLALFGPPLLLQGEDAAAYDTLLTRICAAVKPVDIIEEIFVYDLASLQWEILRWRRCKSSLISTRVPAILEDVLSPVLDYEHYAKEFEEHLTKALLENRAEDQTEDAVRKLAKQCARDEPEATDKVNALLDAAALSLDDILDRAQADKAEKLAQDYARRKPRTIKLVNELLDRAGRTMDDLTTEALVTEFDNIERIDQLTAIAETRRNAALREIDRHRTTLAQALRRGVQEVEDGEYTEIETTPAKGKSAA